jgi:hypothetical protein
VAEASGAAAGASGSVAAEDGDDGVAGWQDTGLKKERVAWRAFKVGGGSATAGPTGGGPGGPGPKEPKGIKDPQLTTGGSSGSQIRVFFTVSGDKNADVYINGKRRGTTPLALMLQPMEYDVEFAGSDARATRTIEVKTYGANEFRFDPGKRKINPVQR